MVLHTDSLNANAYLGLARAFQLQKRELLSDRYFRKASFIAYTRALEAFDSDDLNLAETGFEQTLDIQPLHPLALLRLGEIDLKRSAPHDALEHFKRAVAANPSYSESFVRLGDTYAELELPDSAAIAYRKAISLNINAFEAYLGLADVLSERGEYRLAVEHFDNALLIQPNSNAAKSGRKRAFERL